MANAVVRRVLTVEDEEILTASVDDANIFLEYYFGVTLHLHQLRMVHAAQPNQLLLGGRGSGKTFGFAWGYIYLMTMIPDFRVLWGSYSADQAQIPYTEILKPTMLESRAGRFDKFLPRGEESFREKPFPQIQVRIPVKGMPVSTMQFKTIGLKAATKRGFSLDAIHYDEAGLEPDEKVFTTLRPALRGRRLVTNEPRMGRLSVSTTPTHVEWLRHWWQSAMDPEYLDYAPEKYVAERVSSDKNTALTEEQLASFRLDMTAEEEQVEIQGEFPESLGTDFSPAMVNLCQDTGLNHEIQEMMERGKAEAIYQIMPKLGVIKYQRPMVSGRHYLLSGDPGTGNPPHRNSPVIMVFDITQKPYELVHFHWVAGNGSYKPFFNAYELALAYYKPMFAIFDATGTQKAMDELYFEERGLMVEGMAVTSEKVGMVNAAKIMMMRGDFRLPHIHGLRSQLLNYRMDSDKQLSQDTVMTLVMAAWKLRIFSFISAEEAQSAPRVDEEHLQGRTERRNDDREYGRMQRDGDGRRGAGGVNGIRPGRRVNHSARQNRTHKQRAR